MKKEIKRVKSESHNGLYTAYGSVTDELLNGVVVRWDLDEGKEAILYKPHTDNQEFQDGIDSKYEWIESREDWDSIKELLIRKVMTVLELDNIMVSAGYESRIKDNEYPLERMLGRERIDYSRVNNPHQIFSREHSDCVRIVEVRLRLLGNQTFEQIGEAEVSIFDVYEF
jgi:hypothetical protein